MRHVEARLPQESSRHPTLVEAQRQERKMHKPFCAIGVWPKILVAVFALWGGSAHADTLVVSNPSDAGPRTLRQAILDANASSRLTQSSSTYPPRILASTARSSRSGPAPSFQSFAN